MRDRLSRTLAALRRVAIASIAGLSVAIMLAPGAQADAPERRVALVIGNGAYREVPALANPLTDAKAMSASLKRIGFDVVEGYDLGIDAMRTLVGNYAAKIDGAKVALVYYAGHGVAVGGENYLLPTDAVLRSESDLDFRAMNMSLVLRQMQREAHVNIVVLDACRDNPFAKELARSMKTRSALVSSGLSEVAVSSAAGTMIAFATDPGKTALDGAAGQNSPFTTALLKHMETPGVSISTVMDRVREDVWRSTGERQRPWVNTSIIGEFYLNPAPAPAAAAKVASADISVPLPTAASSQQSFEIKLWEAAERSGSPEDYRAYLEAHPNGYFAQIARNRIARSVPAVAPTPADSAEAGSAKTEAALALSVKERAETQQRLKVLGFDPGGNSGVFGPGTRRALTNWQRGRQKPATGFLTKTQQAELWEESEADYGKLLAARPPVERKVRAAANPQPRQIRAQQYAPAGQQPVAPAARQPSLGEVGQFLGGVGGLVGNIRR